jgi:hypothetical protein
MQAELYELLIAMTDQPIHVDSSVVYGLHGRTMGRGAIRIKSSRGATKTDQVNFSCMKGGEVRQTISRPERPAPETEPWPGGAAKPA